MINDLFIPRERCNKFQLLSLSCVNNLQFNRLRLFDLNYYEFPVISNLNQFPFGLDLPFTHLLSVILNSRYFKLFWFPLTVQNNGVQLYDYDYKNKKSAPGEGIPLPTKEILIMKTILIFYSILTEPQKISNFLNIHWRHYLSTLAERIMVHIKMRPILFMTFLNFFLVPPPPPSLFKWSVPYTYTYASLPVQVYLWRS